MRITTSLALVLGATTALMSTGAQAETQLTFMAFNIYGAGANTGASIDATVAAIKAAHPDVISISETRAEGNPCTADTCHPAGASRAAELAAALGMFFHEQTAPTPGLWANAVFSRYPILGATKDDLGAVIDVNGRKVTVFSVNPDDYPYQPYQLLGIKYGEAPYVKTAAEAIDFAERTRGKVFDALIADATAAEADGSAAVLIGGDFNEPSHRDWTDATVKAGLQPLAVTWPGTSKLEAAGFVDLLRAVYPDPVAKPAITWTPTTAANDPADHHDRIDFVFAKGASVKAVSAAIVGEKAPEADIVVTPWPSDHRAVVATITF